MARIEDTGGNITYTIDDCDCGLTGGCWKCQPIHIRPYPYENRFMDDKENALRVSPYGVLF